ncbi:ATP dependent DNA ligase [Pseudonocardia humida]|uniref:DNA ligase (ATP) n=1 Tax=Pseudonocardia humida TaxID=2800819 RepID=A0ABT1A6R9_9PSEU|nr:histidine kinase [Pseudonocardia humida]MCO1658723.1 histidine kinase [Pseudonocardia humida]
MSGRPTPGAMPDLVPPMRPSTGSGQPPNGPDWVVELDWTGYRCIAYVEPGRRVRLLSANNVSMTAAYPELAEPLLRRSPPGGMVLDGTLVARGEEHAARARLLLRRGGRFRPSEQHIQAVPVDFQVADLLWLDGHATTELAYRDRRGLLEGLGFDEAPVWTTSPMPVSELAAMLRIADTKGVDALHARHLGSRYKPGGRSPLWLKVPVRRVRQVVVGGWTPTDPAHPDTIASLLVGVPEGGGLRYVGRVGVAGEERRRAAELRPLRRSDPPFTGAGATVPAAHARDAIWVRPRLVGLVEFTGFTADGRLRLPRWRGPVDPAEVDEPRWARPTDPPPRRDAPPAEPAPDRSPATAPAREPEPAPDGVRERRLEQHFFYNSLNTIGALIRSDPTRARELLFGFADVSRSADLPEDSTSTLARELDAVRGYLQLEQARFGRRLRVRLDVDPDTPPLDGVAVRPLQVLAVVRTVVQGEIEPLPDGGELTVSVRAAVDGCRVDVQGPGGPPSEIVLPASGASLPG